MLDGLLGRGFSSKWFNPFYLSSFFLMVFIYFYCVCVCVCFGCSKSLIKATRTRIDVLRRRKEATQRFLKGNLAQLLSNGLDINAFGRTEEFLSGLNSLACYDFLEHSCEYILKKLSMIQKHSECPEECREAVGSLMFAAARFSDLPELRDLRDALQERYGSSLEHFVNQKFVERLAIKTPTIDKKIQLLQDIALELSIKWDSRGFQQRMMANPSVPVQAKKQETNLDRGTANKMHIDNETAVNSNKPHQLLKMRSELTSDRLKAKNGGQSYLMRKDELGHRSFGGVESTSNSGKSHMGSERNIAKRDDYGNRGLQEKSELSNDELLANKGKDNYVMRKDELGHRSFGGIVSTGNSGKPQMGSEENTARRYNYDMIPQERRDKSDLSSDELRAKNGGQNYIMRKVELGHRSFEGAESNSGRPPMGIEQNTPRGRRENGELSSDELRAKNRRENYLTRNDELDHLSTGRGQQAVNNVKPHTGSEHNIHRRDYYDGTPLGGLQDGEFSYGLGATNGRGHYFIRKDEDILSPEQGDSRGNRCNPHTGLERSIPRREKNDIISVSRLEDGKFDYDGLQAKHGRANSLMTKDELAHQTYGRSDLRGTNTVRREINNISSHHGKELTGDKNEPTRMNGKEGTVQRRDGHVSSSRGKRPEVTGGIFEAQNDQIYGFPKSSDFVEELPIIRDGKIVSSADCRDYKKPKAAKSHKIIQEEDTYRVKPHSNYAIPPPYVKSKDLPPYMKTVEGKKVISDHGGFSLDPTTHSRDDEKDLSYFEDLGTGHARVRSLGHEKDVPYHDNIPLPKPRSIRRKHSKSSSHRDDLDDFEDLEVVKRISSSRRRDHHHSKKGLQILFEEEHKQKDDEERKIDKLLLHYSKKPSTLEEEKARRKVKTHARENPHNEEAGGFPTRSVSLPRENITSDEQVKVYARANSFQPDKSAGHVHPKLPDYDDLAAQFAALKGR